MAAKNPDEMTYAELETIHQRGKRSGGGKDYGLFGKEREKYISYGGAKYTLHSISDRLKAAEAQAATVRDTYKKESQKIEAAITSGDITEEEGLAQLSAYVKANVTGERGIDTGVAKSFSTDYGDRMRAQRESEKIGAALKELGTTIETQLGEAKAEAMGFLETGETGALGELSAGELAATGKLQEGETAATAAVEGARGAAATELGAARGRATGALETGITELRTEMAPWQQAGEEALGKFKQAFGMAAEGGDLSGVLENLPGFKFRMEKGLQAATRMQSARGNTLGGRALQELQATGQGIASEEFGRYTGALQDLMGRGQRAAEVTGTGVAAMRGQQASLEAGFGQARAGLEMQAGGMTADIITRSSAGQAGIAADIAGRKSAIISATAGQKASLSMGAGQQLASASASLGMQAAGITSDFYKQVFSAETQRDMMTMQQTFQRSMAEWEAGVAKDLAHTQGMYQIFGSLLGAGATIYGA